MRESASKRSKKEDSNAGIVNCGTEIFTSADNSIFRSTGHLTQNLHIQNVSEYTNYAKTGETKLRKTIYTIACRNYDIHDTLMKAMDAHLIFIIFQL